MSNNNWLRTYIYKAYYLTLAVEYDSRVRILNLIQRSYFWPKIY